MSTHLKDENKIQMERHQVPQENRCVLNSNMRNIRASNVVIRQTPLSLLNSLYYAKHTAAEIGQTSFGCP